MGTDVLAKASLGLVICARGPRLRLGSSGPDVRVLGSHSGAGAGPYPCTSMCWGRRSTGIGLPLGEPAAADGNIGLPSGTWVVRGVVHHDL